MEPHDPRVKVLPKWAKDMIRHLEWERDEAIRELEQARKAAPPSSVSLLQSRGEEFYLAEGTTVRFRDATGLWVDVSVNTIGTGVLGPVIKVFGRYTLALLPQSANHIYIRGIK